MKAVPLSSRHLTLSLTLSLTLVVALAMPASAANTGRQNEVHQPGKRPPKLAQPASSLMIVEFEEPPLVAYAGGIPGLEATSPIARGESRLDARSPASQAYLQHLADRQAHYVNEIENALSRSVEVVFSYRAVKNGIAAKLSRAEGMVVARLSGVERVTPDRVAPLHTDRGPLWIGAPSIWDGSATGGLPGTHGEGVIVGIIDTGVNMDHPSFAATGGDGFTHTNPFGAGVFVGWCDPANPNFDPSYLCNDKLVGGWDYTDAYCTANPATCTESDGPEDDNGHGSHTASTTGGNILLDPAMSGVAPHANVITYDACYTDATGQGLCPFSATSAGVDQAVLDGVAATNYSIGGGLDPWGGDIDSLFLNAVAAGTYTAASAGNDGPGAETVGHLGPWMSTTGASTHDRVTVENELIDMSGGALPPSDMTGASRTLGYGPESIVYAGDFSNGDPDPEQCLTAFPAGTWTSGEIVLCDRGTIARVLKCANVAAGGGAGCVLANADSLQTAPVADAHVIPAIHVDFADGNVLRAWLAGGAGHTATITASTLIVDPGVADIMAGFSSRGPNPRFNTLKPDLTAPGSDIFAAVNSGGEIPPPEFGNLSGTSMSSPHNAGSGALMRALLQAWSPAEIKSAIMLTADTTVLKENGVTPADPFDVGGGRIDLTKAALTGLVLDESVANFEAADPNSGGQPGALNLASHQEGACVVGCTFSRTVKSVAGGSVTWSVGTSAPGAWTLIASPTGFTLAPGATQVIDFTADVSGLPLGTFVFGEITLTEAGASPDLHLPVAIRPALENLPDLLEITTFSTTDMLTLQGLQTALAITDLEVGAAGLVEGTQTGVSLFEDPTNGDPYDDLGQVFWKTLFVPGGARRLVAATESDEAPDVDLFMGTGGTPSPATEVCTSTTATATERCELADPATGTYWILVQNWAGSASQPDLIELVDVAVPGTDVGNLSGSGPSVVPAGTPFDLDIAWNVPSMLPGEIWFGALDLGTSPGTPGNIGTIPVDIELSDSVIFADGFESGDTSAWSVTVP